MLSLSFEPEYLSVPMDMDLSSFLTTINLKAPKLHHQHRAGMDLAVVMDRSFSMNGTKLAMVKQAVSALIRSLRNDDHVCLITFDHQVETILPFTLMTAEGKAQALSELARVVARGDTDIASGLFAALDALGNRSLGSRNIVSSVLLMTDGEQRRGITDAGTFFQKTREKLQAMQGLITSHHITSHPHHLRSTPFYSTDGFPDCLYSSLPSCLSLSL